MKQVYPVIFTQLKDKKDTVLINVPDMGILTEGFGLSDAIEMARDAIGANGITLQDLGREIPVPSDISDIDIKNGTCLLYTSPSPRDRQKSRMPSSA